MVSDDNRGTVVTNNKYLSLKGIYVIESQKNDEKWVGQSLGVLERCLPQSFVPEVVSSPWHGWTTY